MGLGEGLNSFFKHTHILHSEKKVASVVSLDFNCMVQMLERGGGFSMVQKEEKEGVKPKAPEPPGSTLETGSQTSSSLFHL